MKEVSKKRGQVTVFIIIGIVIVVLGALVYAFFPQIKEIIGLESENPNMFMQSCIEEEIQNTIEELSLQGGSLNPEHYILYENSTVEYLCYTEEYYKTCVMQQPLLVRHVGDEIAKGISPEAQACFDDLKESYEKKGYDVQLTTGETDVELLPNKVVVVFNRSLVLTKENSDKYENFRVVVNNNIYELLSIANSILSWETRYGDAETTIYMDYYHDLKVEKKKQMDGSTVYILTNRNEGTKFMFASRSIAWPPGYGIGNTL